MGKVNIVVYGCDNSGKTTLCNQLITYLNDVVKVKAKYTKSLGPASMLDQVIFINRHLQDETWDVEVFDRFPIVEEAVCGNVLRHSNHFASHLNYTLMSLNQVTLFIHCDPGIEAILDWGDREQMQGIKENAKALKEAYEAYAAITGISPRVIKYDWKTMDYHNVLYSVSHISTLKSKEDANEHH